MMATFLIEQIIIFLFLPVAGNVVLFVVVFSQLVGLVPA